MKDLINTLDYQGLHDLLSKNPALANEGIPLDDQNQTKAHPLHRICDGVFSKLYTDHQAVEIAKIFLAHGANINGNELIEKKDTPLIAASSLHADEVALLYIDRGANIFHAGCSGGTALHWASWCGRDKVVSRLIQAGAEINKKCIEFQSTPLLWAVHGYKYGGEANKHNQIACAWMLIQAGAEKNTSNVEGTPILEFLDEHDTELVKLLR